MKTTIWASLLVLCVLAFTLVSHAANKVDVQVYTETTQWIAQAQAQQEADTLIKEIKGKKGFGDVVNLGGKDIADWTTKHTIKKGHHIIVLYGDFPPQIYPDSNAKKDGSIAEEFLDAGNTFANSADYFFWGLGGRNKEGGIQNMMDIPGIVMWDDNTPLTVTADGKKIAPSLTDFNSDRPFHVDQLAGDWKVEVSLAQNAAGTRADPIIVRDGKRGRLIPVIQTADGNEPKGAVAAEIITWLFAQQAPGTAIDPKGKLSTTWGALKTAK
ncbi:hypothetical protein HYR99_41920 [Candidatus Poribacteria bacterium]|nr:hypothetical protein [Candidatus Poribacteria bacterium]